MAVGDRYKVVMVTRALEQNGLMVSHWECNFTFGGTLTDQVLADKLSAVVGPLIKAILSEQAAYRGLTLQYIHPNTPRDPVTSVIEQGTGVVEGDLLPSDTSGLFSLKTGLAGRRNRGRKYIPFPGEANNAADATPDTTYKTGASLLAGVFTNDQDLVSAGVTNRLHAGNLNTLTNAFNFFITGLVSADWAHQQRRDQEKKGDVAII